MMIVMVVVICGYGGRYGSCGGVELLAMAVLMLVAMAVDIVVGMVIMVVVVMVVDMATVVV